VGSRPPSSLSAAVHVHAWRLLQNRGTLTQSPQGTTFFLIHHQLGSGRVRPQRHPLLRLYINMAHPHTLSRPQVNRGYSAPALHSALSNHSVSSSSVYTPSSSSSSSSTSSTNSYFSAQAPSTGVSPAISPATPYTSGLSSASPMTPDYPIITATVTSRNQSGITSTNTMHARDDPLRQFALHIPAPPTLSLSAASRQPAPSVHAGAMHTSSGRTSSTLGYDDLPSPMDRSRRMPSSTHAPQMTVASSVYFYTLSVTLPTSIQPEMVTVCANKGDKLKVVADAWHMENESASRFPLLSCD
jgi:hypothetical protein